MLQLFETNLHGDLEELKTALQDAQELEASKRAAIPDEDQPDPTGPPSANPSFTFTLPAPLGLPALRSVTRNVLQTPRSVQCKHGVAPTEMCRMCFPDPDIVDEGLSEALCAEISAYDQAADSLRCAAVYYDPVVGYIAYADPPHPSAHGLPCEVNSNMLNDVTTKHRRVSDKLRTELKVVVSNLAALKEQQCMDVGAASSRTNILESNLVRLEQELDTVRKALASSDQNIAPVLMAHQQQEAAAARRATAARDVARATKRASYLEGIASGLIDPDSPVTAWTPVYPSESEGKRSDSRLPTLSKFTCETKKLDINTFFNLYELWFGMSKHRPADKAHFAILSLDGEAQKQWWPMQLKLKGEGLDPQDYEVFKQAMLRRWAPVAPGLNARGRLDALRQTKSLDAYIDDFNSIVSNAVDNPIIGAEACYFFQKGLKDSTHCSWRAQALAPWLSSLTFLSLLRVLPA